MALVAKHSILNPLAKSFVPASRKTMSLFYYENKTNNISPSACKNGEKTVPVKFSGKMDVTYSIICEGKIRASEKRVTEKSKDIISKGSSGMELDISMLTELTIYEACSKLDSVQSIYKSIFISRELSFSPQKVGWKQVMKAFRRKLRGWGGNNEVTYKNCETELLDKAKETEITEKPENLETEVTEPDVIEPSFQLHQEDSDILETEILKETECNCPPMFGWIIPFDLFGNPLKLPNSCSNESIHLTSYNNEKVNGEKTKLEQYSCELQAILKDICDSIASCDKGCENPDPTPEASLKESNSPLWNTATAGIISDMEINDDDDGVHPLLQGKAAMDSIDDEEIATIEKFLEKCLPGKKTSDPHVSPPQNGCNPPCSIWCSSLPPTAKDTFKKFMTKLHKTETNSNFKPIEPSFKRVSRKPVYKRCFSADDAPKHSSSQRASQLISSAEAKERLQLLHKDPIAFIKLSSTHNKKLNSSFLDASNNTTRDTLNGNDSDMWGLYGSTDSLWQPLPDCVPLTEHTQKQSHRRVREMRRQRSVC